MAGRCTGKIRNKAENVASEDVEFIPLPSQLLSLYRITFNVL